MRDGNVWAPKSHFWSQRLPAWHRQVDRCSLQHLYVGSTSEQYFSHFGTIFPLDWLFEVALFSMFFSSFPIFRRWKLKILIWKFIFLKVLEISSILRYRKLSSDLWARRTRSKRFWKTFFLLHAWKSRIWSKIHQIQEFQACMKKKVFQIRFDLVLRAQRSDDSFR